MVVVGNDAGTVDVREYQVIELWQEAWRGWGVRVGPWSIRQVE